MLARNRVMRQTHTRRTHVRDLMLLHAKRTRILGRFPIIRQAPTRRRRHQPNSGSGSDSGSSTWLE